MKLRDSPFLELGCPFTAYEALKMLLLLPWVPLRLCLGGAALVALAVINSAAAWGVPPDQPLPAWRRNVVLASKELVGVVLWALGFRVRVAGRRHLQQALQLGAVGVFNHASWVDAFLLVWLMAPSGVSKADNAQLPVIGSAVRALQTVFIPYEKLSKQRRAGGASAGADRYIPSKDQLEVFFDAVCDSFGIDLAALKAAAAAPPPGPNGSVSLAAAAAATGSTGSASGSVQSLDLAVPASAASAASMGSVDVIGSGTAGGSGSGSGSGSLPRPSFFLDAEAMRSVSGGTGISDGVAGGFGAAAAAQPPQPPPPATAAALSAAAAAATAAAAANVAASRAAAAAAARREEAAAEPPPTPSSLAAARAKAASLGSLDTRPKGSLLQPSEAQSMLTLLDQYRGLLLEAKRSDLLITMNTYRNAVTAALHDMRRKEAAAAAAAAAAGGGAAGLGGAAGGVGAVGSGKVPPSAKLLQAVLRGGAGVTPPPPEPVM